MIGTQDITNWRKSSRSEGNGSCVELGHTATVFGVRDTKQAGLPAARRPALVFPLAARGTFIASIQA